MTFQTSGTVKEVLVKEGDSVKAGQVLARLDDRDLQLEVASAQAALDSAKTKLTQTRDGNVQPAEIAAQKAAPIPARPTRRAKRSRTS